MTNDVRGPLNSAKTPEAQPVGGIYNSTPPAPLDGQGCALQVDSQGRLLVSSTGGGGGGGNVNITGINSNPPALTNPLPVELSDGTNAFGTAGNPLFTETVSGSTTVVTQTTASNLNATVVGTLTNNNASPTATNIGALTALANAASPLWNEGDQVLQSVDLHGGQRIISANVPEVTATWTSATAQNTALSLTVTGYGSVVVTLNQVGTVTPGVVAFQASDANTNFYPVTTSSLQVAAGTNTYTLANGTLISFQFSVSGYTTFRVLLSSVITGGGSVTVGIQASTMPPAYPSLFISGTLVSRVEANTGNSAPADNLTTANWFSDSANTKLPLYIAESVYGGAFSGSASAALQGWSKRRVPTVFKTAQATASGNTAVWTPASGNKFRLLKVFVELTDNASLASGAVLTIDIRDSNTTTNITFDVFVPTTAVTTVVGDGLEQELDLGDFGILSAAANNVLNVNLSATLATGNVRIITMGTEE